MAHCVAQLYCAVLRWVCLIDEAPPQSPMSVIYLPHMHTHVNWKHSVAPPLLITSLPSLVIIQRSVCANGTSPKPEILLRLSQSTKY